MDNNLNLYIWWVKLDKMNLKNKQPELDPT